MATKTVLAMLKWIEQIIVTPVLLYRYKRYGCCFRVINLGEGEFTIVEPKDYRRIGRLKWQAQGSGTSLYAVRNVKAGPKLTKMLYMHREIKNAHKGRFIDHQNFDPLDNRDSNLRSATRRQNSRNRRKMRGKAQSKYIGVLFDKRTGKWFARIKYKGKQKRLGSFYAEEDAAKAYDRAAKKYFRDFAHLNFAKALRTPRLEMIQAMERRRRWIKRIFSREIAKGIWSIFRGITQAKKTVSIGNRQLAIGNRQSFSPHL